MTTSPELLTPQETALVSGAPLKEVYKLARERLPRTYVVRRGGRLLFTPAAAICARIDRDLPKDVPVKVRKVLYAKVGQGDSQALEHRSGALRYVYDAEAARRAVTAGLSAYRRAMRLIVEDPDVQGGAATFRGTRVLVQVVADLLKQGVPDSELLEDFPNLTADMVEAARVYARAHPRRGRPRAPAWRSGAAAKTIRRKRTAA